MSSRMIVASIDFGTTYSGWAFSFRHEYESDPKKVFARQWPGTNLVSMKAPTCVLIKPDGKTLENFGYGAEDGYADHVLDGDHHEWYFFKRFKMMLFHHKELTKETQIDDASGKSLHALTVFSLCIEYLKNDLVSTVQSRFSGEALSEKDIRWVITVPAIWDDSAKGFMREAAEMAKIDGHDLLIALEPESASLYCHHLPAEKGKQGALSTFSAGTKYLVLDAGGGTVDITVHEVTSHGGLKELHKASGGAWGGTKVDEAYEQFIEDISGNNGIISRYRESHMEHYLDLFRDFEIKKREITTTKSNKINFRIPSSLLALVEEITGKDIKTTISESKYNGSISFIGDKVRLESAVAVSLFDKPVKSIVSHVGSLLKKPAVTGCQIIFMVGGFSESLVVQEAMKSHFPEIKFIVPQEAGLAVLKGAVIFGHDPGAIAQRILRCTYGQESTHEFKDECLKTHPDGDRERDENGVMRCFNIFDVHARAGQAVRLGEEQPEQIYTPLYDEQTEVASLVLATEEEDPKFVTEACHEIGKWSINIPDRSKGRNREFGVSFRFGGTEVEVKIVDKATGKETIEHLKMLELE